MRAIVVLGLEAVVGDAGLVVVDDKFGHARPAGNEGQPCQASLGPANSQHPI